MWLKHMQMFFLHISSDFTIFNAFILILLCAIDMHMAKIVYANKSIIIC